MKTPTFDINIAVLGYVSAGKSTVINALLQDKFSEVAMRRTTAGVNFFRLHTAPSKSDDPQTSSSNETSTNIGDSIPEPATSNNADSIIWSVEPETIHSARDTLKQITEDNSILRNHPKIKESYFDIQLNKPLCDMRNDTKLVLIDIPGLNEAGSKDMYLDYVTTKWDTFDCVIAVMDVFQGVNTEEQVELLKLIKKQCTEKKNVPVIVLCNKVDDFANEEIKMLVAEVRTKVTEIFQSTGFIIHPCITGAFIPVSAENAFVYRTASFLSYEKFRLLGNELIEKLGCDEVPRSVWRKLSLEEKYQAAYKVASDDSTCEEGLKASNFHVFLDSLRQAVGGSERQLSIICKQQETIIKKLNFDKIVAKELQNVYDSFRLIGKDQFTLTYAEYFWEVYNRCSKVCVATFRSEMDLNALNGAMKQLIAYDAFLQHIGGNKAEEQKLILEMSSLVRLQMGKVVHAHTAHSWFHPGSFVDQSLCSWDNEAKCWRQDLPLCEQCQMGSQCTNSEHLKVFVPSEEPSLWSRMPFSMGGGWKNNKTGETRKGVHYGDIAKPPQDCPHLIGGVWGRMRGDWAYNPLQRKLTWEKLSPLDLCTISESILLMSCFPTFCMLFGKEKLCLESIVYGFHTLVHPSLQHNPRGSQVRTVLDMCLSGTYNEHGIFIPKSPDKYQLVKQIQMPSCISDPAHWGYLAWQFCTFLSNRESPSVDVCKTKMDFVQLASVLPRATTQPSFGFTFASSMAQSPFKFGSPQVSFESEPAAVQAAVPAPAAPLFGQAPFGSLSASTPFSPAPSLFLSAPSSKKSMSSTSRSSTRRR